MLFTPHLLVGAAIGLVADDWWWIIFLSLVFHILLDIIPHYDPSYTKTKKYYLWSAGDLWIGLIGVWWLVGGKVDWKILLAIMVSILPDVWSFLVVTGKWRWWYWFVSWHKKIQFDCGLGWGMLTQFLVVVIVVLWKLFVY